MARLLVLLVFSFCGLLTTRCEQFISDCSCDFESVNDAVSNFFRPVFSDLTKTIFFRYFRVNLDQPCPFWQADDDQCMMEGCSVCMCENDEIPIGWISETDKSKKTNLPDDELTSNMNSDTLSALNTQDNDNKLKYLEYLHETEDFDDDSMNGQDYRYNQEDWIDMRETNDHDNTNVYINLLHNPESYTGYSGISARRVWNAIQNENCFGGNDDSCVEKRVFYRLMSGLQASISTHIAKYYYYSATNSYGTNTKLYQSAVGDHPERVNNLYFTFIFLLRAVIKAKDHLLEYPYYTGNSTDDALVAAYFTKLYDNSITLNNIITINDINECKNGFDESILFQEHVPVDALGSDEQLCEGGRKNKILLEEFRNRFRNITKIMDCVSCDKCRIWGKVQILGIGTAIKILLTPNEDFRKINGLQLHRQEVIALVNTIHQFSTSVDFAYSAGKQLPGGSPSSQNLVIAIVTSLCIIIVTFVKICKSRLR